MTADAYQRLLEGNRRFMETADRGLLTQLAREGQHPCAIVICCSDSRVAPEHVFSAHPGDLFTIRVAGNVLDAHQLGSIEYAAAHLGCSLVVMLGHTGCGAVEAALSGHSEGLVSYIVDDILEAIGDERDPHEAARLNVLHGVDRIKEEFAAHPEVEAIDVRGALYNIETGFVEWL